VPHYYPLTHYFFSYKFGFIKRAFIGTMMMPLLEGRSNEQVILIISIFAAIMLFILLGVLLYEWIALASSDQILFLTGLVFFTSPFISFISNDFGYLDPIIYLITIICLWCILNKKSIWIVIILNICAVLIQEIYLISCFPLLVFVLACQTLLENEHADFIKKMPAFFSKIAIYAIINTVLFLLIYKGRPSEELEAYLKSMNIMSTQMIEWGTWTLRKSFYENWLAGFKLLGIVNLLKILPSTFFYLFLSLYIYGKSLKVHDKKSNALLLILIPISTLSPMLLFLVAWDVGRILSFTNINAFLIFCVLIKFTNGRMNILSEKYRRLFISSILLCTLYNLYMLDKLPLMFGNNSKLAILSGFKVITICDLLFR